MSLGIQLHLKNVQLSLGLIILFPEPVHLLLLGVELNPVSALDVLLDFHAHDVCINRQRHLVGHCVDLALFLFYSSAHIVKSRLDRQLKLLLCLDFLGEPFLELTRLRPHLLIVALEISIECIYLLFLSICGLQMTFNGR